MTEIYVNTSQYVYFDLYNTTADATPTAQLERVGSPAVTLSVSSVVTPPSGVSQRWRAYIPISETDSAGEFDVRWSASVGGESMAVVDSFEVVTPYATPEQLAAKYGWSFNPSDPNYKDRDEVAAAERIARYTINSYTRRSFGPVYKSVDAYGQNTDSLVLSEPIVSVSRLYENGKLVIDGVDFSEFGYAVEPTETDAAIRIVSPDFIDLDEAEKPRVLSSGGKFRLGYRYTVEGVFGTARIPTVVEDCVGMLAFDYMCRDATWRNRYINHVQMRDWKFNFEKEAFRGTGNLTVDTLLGDFRNLGFIVI